MQKAYAIKGEESTELVDQRVVLHQLPWAHFEAILALRGDNAVPRMSYLEGELELMSPSRNHECIKKLLARMIELYSWNKNIRLTAYGSWTLRNALTEAAVEPDECYALGDPRLKDKPDLAIEVVWTRGGLNKLEVYRRLQVGEVWFWRNDAIEILELHEGQYRSVEISRVFPFLDIKQIARLAGLEDQNMALEKFRAILDAPTPAKL